MSAIAATKAALTAALATQLPDTQIAATPLAEDTALRESVWIERVEADFEWQLLGPPAANRRRETIGIDLVVHVYREDEDQTDASAAALTRADEILDEIEDAAEANETLGGAVDWWLVTRWTLEPRPRENGWAADGRAHIEAIKNP